jgi:hypothetical protein
MYRIEWIWAGFPVGAVTLLLIPVVGPMVGLLAILAILVAIVFALVKAIVATPFLIVRAVRRHRQGERALPSETASTQVSRPSLLSAAGPHTAAPRSA